MRKEPFGNTRPWGSVCLVGSIPRPPMYLSPSLAPLQPLLPLLALPPSPSLGFRLISIALGMGLDSWFNIGELMGWIWPSIPKQLGDDGDMCTYVPSLSLFLTSRDRPITNVGTKTDNTERECNSWWCTHSETLPPTETMEQDRVPGSEDEFSILYSGNV